MTFHAGVWLDASVSPGSLAVPGGLQVNSYHPFDLSATFSVTGMDFQVLTWPHFTFDLYLSVDQVGAQCIHYIITLD